MKKKLMEALKKEMKKNDAFRMGVEQKLLFKIPKVFYDDHMDRDLPAPAIYKETKHHYWISVLGEHLDELLADADHYVYMQSLGAWEKTAFGLVASARATMNAIEKGKEAYKKYSRRNLRVVK